MTIEPAYASSEGNVKEDHMEFFSIIPVQVSRDRILLEVFFFVF